MKIDDELRHAADLAMDDGPSGHAALMNRAADRIQELEEKRKQHEDMIIDLDRYREAVLREGKRLCDIPACNCGGLHDA